MAVAIAPDEPVTTLLMPMYRPDSAFGMMSVMSAQSTARKIPDATPIGTANARARPVDGRQHEEDHPAEPDDRRGVDHPLLADPARHPARRHGREGAEDDDEDRRPSAGRDWPPARARDPNVSCMKKNAIADEGRAGHQEEQARAEQPDVAPLAEDVGAPRARGRPASHDRPCARDALASVANSVTVSSIVASSTAMIAKIT